MAITIGIKKIICLDTYPETDYDLMKEAGIEIIQLEKKKIQRWASVLFDEPKR
jgi:dCMP deaminase